MKSETNRALVAKKKELHNPIPLGLPRQWKVIASTIILLFTMGIGQMWGAKYYLFTPTDASVSPAHTGTLSGDFICQQTPTSDSKTIETVTCTHYVKVTANTSLSAAWTTQVAGTTTLDYDMKTTSATFTIYAYNNNSTNYGICKAEVQEGSDPTSFSQVGEKWASSTVTRSFTVTATTNKRVRIGTENKDKVRFYQIVVEETGDALPQPASGVDYVIDFAKKRCAVKAKGTASLIDGIEIVANSDVKYNGTNVKLSNGSNSHTYYIKFTTSATCNDTLIVTTNSKAFSINTVPDEFAASGTNSGTKIILSPSTTYWIQGQNQEVQVSKIQFIAPKAPASTYTVNYYPNGGSGAEVIVDAAATEVAAGSIFTAPTDKAFSSWNTQADGNGDAYDPGDAVTENLTLHAQWIDYTESSDATLSALSVAGCTLNETFDPDEEDYTISLPFYASMPVVGDVTATKNDANAEDPIVSISSNVITIHCEAEDGTEKDYTITVTIAPTPTASSSINIEQLVLDNGKSYDIVSALTAANIVTDGRNGLDSLNDVGKTNRNYAYLGLKLKKANADIIKIVVPAEKALNVKFGNVGVALTTTINGVAGSNVAKKTDGYSSTFHLDAAAVVREVVFHSSENQTVTLQQVKIDADVDPITLPWLVTYDAGEHGTCATAKQTWTGTALTLPGVTPASGWTFDGWNDGADDYAAGVSYTPTTNVTMTAQYTAQASPYDLTSLTYKIGTGAATAVGYEDGKFTYNIELPYAPSYDAITVAPTLKVGTSYLKGDEVLTVSSLPGAATFTVVEAGGASERLYTVNFSKEAKEGLSIIETKVTGQNAHGPVGGLIGGDAAVAVASSYKLNSGNYVGVTLAGSNKFQAGDVVVIRVTNAENATGFTLYTTNDADSALIIDTRGASVVSTGLHYITLPETYPDGVTPYAGTPSVYLLRANNSTTGNMNPRVDSIAVLRAMNPVLKAIRFNSTDVAVTSTSVSATLPNGTNLGTMTITPTIAWNGAGTSVVTSNAGAWAWGENTYVVTDKDGDATTYTITLTEDVLKHTVSFNTHGGSTVDPVEVEHNGYLAAAPTAPTKTDYEFQYWSLSDGGAEVDVTTVQITEDKEFHAVWAAEPAGITLFDGEGNLNTTNFVSPAKTTIEISEVEYTCLAEFASNRSSSLAGATPADMVQYNATTDQAKIKMTFYNNNSGVKKAILYKYEEGAEAPEKIEIEVPGQTIFTTDYYTFNSSKNRSFYVCMNDRSNIRVLQVKVIDNGANPVKQFGQAGYSLNFNKGRLYAKDGVEKSFEGWTLTASSEYKVYNNSNLATKSANTFTVASAVLMHVEKSGGKYYVYQDPADKGTLYDANADIELNTTGTWYISSETASAAASFTKIEFIAPKCAEPAFNSLANSDICSGDPYVALNGTATVADAGVPTYKWYAEGADESDPAAVLGTGATYTPEADGNYYVIATNHLAGYTDNTKKSDLVTVTTHAGTTITGYTNANGAAGATGKQISVTAEGVGTLHYVWYTCDDELGSNPVALPENDAATLSGITIPSGIQYYKVVVTSTCGSAEQILFAKEWVDVELQDVTGSMIWNWHKTQNPDAWTGIDGDITVASTSVLANVNYGQIPNVTNFHSAMLKVVVSTVETKIRKGTDNGVIQGNEIMFHTTVPGIVIVTYRGTGNSANVTLTIGSETLPTYAGSMTTSKKVFVPAGDVVISSGSDAFRIQKIQFIAEADYPRNVTEGRFGTICLPNGGVMVGADIFEVAYMDYQAGHPYKIYFDEVLNGEMVAGRPYIFLPKVGATQLGVFYTDAAAAEAGHYKGLYGSYTRVQVTPNAGNYILLNNQYYFVDSDNVYCGANKAYIKLADVPQHDPGMPAYGRRRISMGVNAENVATGLGEVQGDEVQSTKVIIDGHLYILRGEKMYDATGRLVK